MTMYQFGQPGSAQKVVQVGCGYAYGIVWGISRTCTWFDFLFGSSCCLEIGTDIGQI